MKYKSSLDNFKILLNDTREKLTFIVEYCENEVVRKGKWSEKEILKHLRDSYDINKQRLIRLDSDLNEFFAHYNEKKWIFKTKDIAI